MTYDTWKSTEPNHETGFVCDDCALMFPERDMVWLGSLVYCPRCAEKHEPPRPQA